MGKGKGKTTEIHIVQKLSYSFSIIQVQGEVTSHLSLFQTSQYLSRWGNVLKKSEVRK